MALFGLQNILPTKLVGLHHSSICIAEYFGNKIGRITISGGITEYTIPTANSNGAITEPTTAACYKQL